MEENPYRVPQAALAEPPAVASGAVLGRFGSENGSRLEIGPRRHFTAQWIGRNSALGLVGIVAWTAPLLWWITHSTVIRHGGLWLLLVAPMATPFVVLAVAPLLYAGFPRVARPRSGSIPSELAFEPRLDGSPRELRDKADDLGFVWIDGSFLAYRGDRVALRVHRSDVDAIANVWTVNAFSGAWSPELEVRLSVPLAGRRSFRLVRRDTFRTPLAPIRNATLRRQVRGWLAAQA
jgi:hypothetical protein